MNHIGFEIGHRKRNISVHISYVSISDAHRPKVTEDGSPGIDDPDGAVQEYGTREHHRKQDGFLKNGTEKHNTHTQKQYSRLTHLLLFT